jgi:hypothetical protein
VNELVVYELVVTDSYGLEGEEMRRLSPSSILTVLFLYHASITIF